MIDADQLAYARAVDVATATGLLGASLKRVTSVELAGPCLVCGGRDRFSINSKQQVWHCRGCGKGGNVIALVQHIRGCDFREAVAFLTGGEARPTPQAPRPVVDPKNGDNRGKALTLWRRRQPVVEDDPVWRYLREARVYDGPIPTTIGHLPARGEHPPSMIAAFGLADEPEPGMLAVRDDVVRAVHLTRLAADGSGKAGTAADKVTIGHGSVGTPIVLAPPNEQLGLAITEGMEDGLSIFRATNLGVWVAGSAGRMPGLADTIPGYVECVSIFAHRDPAGERGAHELAARLVNRGVETLVKFLEATWAP
jgi:hypothetical protein